MASTTIHVSLSVRGALDWDIKESREALRWLFQDDGKPFPSVDAMRDCFKDLLAAGVERIPMSNCDNFDPKKGCLGHRVEEASVDAR